MDPNQEPEVWWCWLPITSSPTNQRNVHELFTHPTRLLPHPAFINLSLCKKKKKCIVDLQHCANFCYTAKWLSYTHTYRFFFKKYYFSLWFIPGDWTYFSVLYSRTLFIHSQCDSWHLLTPHSQFICLSPPSSSPLATTGLFSVCESVSVQGVWFF